MAPAHTYDDLNAYAQHMWNDVVQYNAPRSSVLCTTNVATNRDHGGRRHFVNWNPTTHCQKLFTPLTISAKAH